MCPASLATGLDRNWLHRLSNLAAQAVAGAESLVPISRSIAWSINRKPWDANTTRNPRTSFSLFGLLLLRLAQRTLFSLLFHDPPRNVSASPYNNGFVGRSRLLPCDFLPATQQAA